MKQQMFPLLGAFLVTTSLIACSSTQAPSEKTAQNNETHDRTIAAAGEPGFFMAGGPGGSHGSPGGGGGGNHGGGGGGGGSFHPSGNGGSGHVSNTPARTQAPPREQQHPVVVARPIPAPGANHPGEIHTPARPAQPVQPPRQVDHEGKQQPAPARPTAPVKPGTPVVSQQPHANAPGQPTGTHSEHTVENLGPGHIRTSVTNHDKAGNVVSTAKLETKSDGSFTRELHSKNEDSVLSHDKHGLEVQKLGIHEADGHVRNVTVFEDKKIGNRKFGGEKHDEIVRHYWDNHENHFFAWRDHTYWGWHRDWFVFGWTYWDAAYWPWYCGLEVDGFCVTQHDPWVWTWGWHHHPGYTYNLAADWYQDQLFSRYWRFRHEEEMEHEDENIYWAGQLGETLPSQGSWFDAETKKLNRHEIDMAIKEANSGANYDPSQLVGVGRGFYPGIDYSVNFATSDQNEQCTLTRGSVVKVTTAPTADNRYAVAQIMYSYDPHSDEVIPLCTPGELVSIDAATLVEMSNDFRSRVQDALSEKDGDTNARSIAEVLDLKVSRH